MINFQSNIAITKQKKIQVPKHKDLKVSLEVAPGSSAIIKIMGEKPLCAMSQCLYKSSRVCVALVQNYFPHLLSLPSFPHFVKKVTYSESENKEKERKCSEMEEKSIVFQEVS